eukprot:s115_g13.t1
MVFNHATEEPFRKCSKWDEYLDELQKQVETPELKSRALVIFAHSHGCLAEPHPEADQDDTCCRGISIMVMSAYGLAKRLGKRVVKLYVAARRPPNLALLDEVWGVSSGSADFSIPGEIPSSPPSEGRQTCRQWPRRFAPLFGSSMPHLVPQAAGGLWFRASLQSTGMIYAARGSADLAVALGSDYEELEKGETAEKMEGWRSLAGGDFELRTVNADHMDCLTPETGKTPEMITLVVEDMRKLRSSDSG